MPFAIPTNDPVWVLFGALVLICFGAGLLAWFLLWGINQLPEAKRRRKALRDAAESHGRAVGLPRISGESDDAYVARLIRARK